MAIRDLIEQIASSWPSYHQKVRVDKIDPVFSVVETQFPDALRPHLSSYNNLKLEGSTGAGNITAAPWIAAFDRRLTTSATTGYYVVYLFSVDMSTVTLTLAFGTTQFEKQFGGPAKAFPRMRAAAFRLQEMFGHLIPSHLSRGLINLGATPSEKLHYAYQQSAILSCKPYLIGSLPQESQIVADLQELVRIYTEIVSDPLEATVERLVEAVVEPAVEPQSIQVFDFKPRQPKKSLSGGHAYRRGQRYSPESRKIGDAGERVVLMQEKNRWTQAGRPDLADRVRWHPPKQEYPGWDITSFDDDGAEIYIEVKSSAGKTMSL